MKQHLVTVKVHGRDIITPISGTSKGLAKMYAAEAALKILQDEDSAYNIIHLCTCKLNAEPKPKPPYRVSPMEIDGPSAKHGEASEASEATLLQDEQEDGFAQLVEDLMMEGLPNPTTLAERSTTMENDE
jgi:hypothetical protein